MTFSHSIVRSLAFVALATAAACTSSGPESSGQQPSQKDASHALALTSARLSAASKQIGGGKLRGDRADLTGTVDVSAPCASGGKLSVTGSYEGSTTGAHYDVTAAFQTCQEADALIEGSLHWLGTVDAAKTTDSWKGSIKISMDTGVYQCAIDYAVTTDAAGAHTTGTICGYDAAKL